MELLSVLGQYLLLSFVLPGFCYLAVFYLCFPGALAEVFPGVIGQMHNVSPAPAAPPDGKKEAASQGLWITLLAVVGGLLLSSVAFWIEILLRCLPFFERAFPHIPFERLTDSKTLANFFTPEAFMHFNIGVGIMIILVVFMIEVTWRREWSSAARKSPQARLHVCHPAWLVIGLAVVAVANLHVSSYLFHRVHDIVATFK
jgi:hypothetical protein